MSRVHVILSSLMILANAAVSAYFYPRLPNPCPIHWNLHGQIDGYGSPITATVLSPAITLGLLLLLMVIPLIGPFRRNLEQFRVTYGRIAVLLMMLFLGIQIIMLLSAAGHHIRMGASMTIMFGVIFAVLGNWMGKVRRNFYVGIRTPWTLANEHVWERTHRLGGRLFVAAGLLTAITGLFASDVVCAIVLFSTIGVSVLWSVLYSLYLYRKLGQVDDLASNDASSKQSTEL